MSDEQQDAGLVRLRLNILSMIRHMYEVLNSEYYDPLWAHLYFHKNSGDWTSKKDTTKWMQVHSLFDANKYSYKHDEKKENM